MKYINLVLVSFGILFFISLTSCDKSTKIDEPLTSVNILEPRNVGSEPFKMDMKIVYNHLLKNIQKDYPLVWENYRIKDTYFEHIGNAEFIKITLEIGEIMVTKSYFTDYNPDGSQKGPIFEIDCKGNCGSNSGDKICTEQYNINKGSVQCAC